MTVVKIAGWILFAHVFIKLIAFLPTYWTYKVYEKALLVGEYFSELVIGIIVHIAWIIALWSSNDFHRH